jgi:arsenate reductase
MNEWDDKRRILFICTHNSARSQMAEGLVNGLFNKKYKAFSAGTEPAVINPFAVKAMIEIGIDISKHTSKGLDDFLSQEFDYVITVCDNANENCPFFPGGKERIHKGFKDPAAVEGTDTEKLEVFRLARDEIKAWLMEILI